MSTRLARLRATLFGATICILLAHPALAAFTTTGDITPDPNTTTDNDILYVGKVADGTMLVDDGSDVESYSTYLGSGFNVTGSAVVDGAGSTLTTKKDVYVGYSGTGTLNITNGGSVSSHGSTASYLGFMYDSIGEVTVEDTGSTWTVDGSLGVGGYGAGILNINTGGLVNVGRTTSVGSRLQQSTINFGGGTLTTGTLDAAATALTGTGTVNTHGLITDIDLVFDLTHPLQQQLSLDSQPGQDITINLDTDGTGYLGIGRRGEGSLRIAGGVIVPSYIGFVGLENGSSSIATVEGSGSTWDIAYGLHVSRYSGSTGTLNIIDGGVVNAGSTQVWGSGGHVVFDGGTLNTDELLAAWSQLSGTGVVNTHGLVSDVDLMFDLSHPLQQDLVFDDEPGQDVAIHLDVNGEGALGAGYGVSGSLTIAEGVVVTSQYGYVGYLADSAGTANVTGDGTRWEMKYSDSSYCGLYVGRGGTGVLNITDGAVVANATAYLGSYAGATGTVLVDGATWNNTGLHVGDNGDATLTITGGSQVTSDTAYIGGSSDATASVTVDNGSSWESSGILYVGYSGSGATLTIASGGNVSCVRASVDSGSVVIDGSGSSWVVEDFLRVGNTYDATVTITGGTVDVGGHVYLGNRPPDGTINLSDGILRLHGGKLINDGEVATLNFTGGRLEGAGSIDLDTPLVQQGGTLAPGNSAGMTTIEGGYTIDGGTIEIDINGHGTAGVDWDMVDVNGAVNLIGDDGRSDSLLSVVLGFGPAVGDAFLVLDNDGSDAILGVFANGGAIQAPYEGSLYRFTVNYAAGDGNDIALMTSLVTQVVSLVGDYNGDGTVDAADYTVWRDTLGAQVAPFFGADGNGDGIVNDADQAVWKAHFGATAGGGEGALAAVPEPAAALLLAGGAVLGTLARRRRWGRAGRSSH